MIMVIIESSVRLEYEKRFSSIDSKNLWHFNDEKTWAQW
jgi:hypothetical protein